MKMGNGEGKGGESMAPGGYRCAKDGLPSTGREGRERAAFKGNKRKIRH